jgi:molybdopterin adenylyltransferase
METVKIGIVTTSDRAFHKIYEDISGNEIKKVMLDFCLNPIEFFYELIPDEQALIEQVLIQLCDVNVCDIVLTTGGTGPAPRDCTVEATENICQKILPGFGELMRRISFESVPTAILSRQTAGIRNKTLVVNLPGKPAAIRECLAAVFPSIPYCVFLINGKRIVNNESKISVFFPKS